MTHQGAKASYLLLQEILANLQVPFKLLIGNHDKRATFKQVFSETASDDEGFIQHSVDLEKDYRLVFLDTASDIAIGSVGRDIGVLCKRRLAWLRNLLQRSQDKQVLVFMHHPPHAVGFPGMDAIKLINGSEFYTLLAKYSNVKQLFTGHIHRTISGSKNGVPFATFKSTGLQMPLNFNSVDTSLAVDEPPGIGVILLDDDSVIVHEDNYSFMPIDRQSPWKDTPEAMDYWEQANNYKFKS